MRLSPLLVLCLHWCPASADWVTISTGAPAPVAPATHTADLPVSSSSQNWVPLQGHRLRPPKGYDSGCLGNVMRAKRVPPLLSARNFALVAPISVGSPPQEFELMLDAYSGDLWLPSMRCESCAFDSKEQLHFFNASRSKSFSPQLTRTMFGEAPRAIRLIEGGGHVAGFVVNDSFSFGGFDVTKQPFILAEEGDAQARKERAWDGIFGLGRRSPESGGPSFHSRLRAAGKSDVYVLAPVPGREGSNKAARLSVGVDPDSLDSLKPFAWTSAVTEGVGSRGSWTFKATASLPGLDEDMPIRAAIETGTSFLLVPAHQYLKLVRTLLPNFDQYCGVDKTAGNVVICDCEIKKQLAGSDREITFDFKGTDGTRHGVRLKSDDLFEQAPADPKHWMAASTGVCVLQVQQRPHSSELDSAFGVLGRPTSSGGHHFGGHFPGAVFRGPPLGLPFGGPGPIMMPGADRPPPGLIGHRGGPMMVPAKVVQGVQKAMERAEEKVDEGGGKASFVDSLLKSLGKIGGTGAVMKEEVSEYLGDGKRCVTEVTRDRKGKVAEETSWLIGADGSKKKASSPECSKTKAAASDASRRLEEEKTNLRGLPGLYREMEDEQEGSLWILGDVFLRRHAVAFDFEQNRIGFAVHEAHGQFEDDMGDSAPESLPATEYKDASIQAWQGSDDSVRQFQAADAAKSQQSSMDRQVDEVANEVTDQVQQEEGTTGSNRWLAITALILGCAALYNMVGKQARPRRDMDEPYLGEDGADSSLRAQQGGDFPQGAVEDDAAE